MGIVPLPQAEGVARSVKTAGRIRINEIMQLPYLKRLSAGERQDLVAQLDGLLGAVLGARGTR